MRSITFWHSSSNNTMILSYHIIIGWFGWVEDPEVSPDTHDENTKGSNEDETGDPGRLMYFWLPSEGPTIMHAPRPLNVVNVIVPSFPSSESKCRWSLYHVFRLDVPTFPGIKDYWELVNFTFPELPDVDARCRLDDCK
ncbi:hypothetical protein ONS95_004529 [Cadophora gregata]|uniref:uncharacterized protein n=1 Tax=Cadophora gregata TaxID=51156 RepID=UPI0026DB6B44|nr:uncharacterized protein ONS95_004529 [Cadophora gregata]KAK0106023.1 hypothetical protein ONS95_004529 [Cadophora gregata]